MESRSNGSLDSSELSFCFQFDGLIMLWQQMAQASAGSAAKSFQTFLETITNSVVSLLALLLKANRRYG